MEQLQQGFSDWTQKAGIDGIKNWQKDSALQLIKLAPKSTGKVDPFYIHYKYRPIIILTNQKPSWDFFYLNFVSYYFQRYYFFVNIT